MARLAFEHKFLEGKYFLKGEFTEQTDFDFLLKATPPLRLQLREINQISSIGCRKWLAFLKAWGQKPLELYACPPPLGSLMNMVPQFFNESKGNIKIGASSLLMRHMQRLQRGRASSRVSCR